MRGDKVTEVSRAEVLLSPEVANRLQPRDVQLPEVLTKVDFGVGGAEVEDAQGMGAVAERSHPDLDVAVLNEAPGLFAEDVLINGIHLVVAEQANGKVVNLGNVAADEHVAGQQ